MNDNLKKQKIVSIFFHSCFIISVLLFFRYNSILRPIVNDAIYKEFLSALILLFMVYINYLYFIPKFFLKRKLAIFFMFFLTSICLATSLEMILVIPNIITRFPSSFNEQNIRSCIMMQSIFVGGRDSAFLLFFFVIRIFEHEKQTLEKERIALAKNKGFICVPSGKDTLETISISDISYIIHERNYTFIHTLDGKKYVKYTSLSNIEDILPDTQFLRINRKVIIPICEIVRFSQDSVTISYGNPSQEMTFPLSKNFVPDLKERFASAVGLNYPDVGLNIQNDGLKIVSDGLNDGLNSADLGVFLSSIAYNEELLSICRMIAKDPSITMKNMSEQLQVSLKTIERKIKYLKDKGILQHSGAKKNGEYVFTSSISSVVTRWLACD